MIRRQDFDGLGESQSLKLLAPAFASEKERRINIGLQSGLHRQRDSNSKRLELARHVEICYMAAEVTLEYKDNQVYCACNLYACV